MNHFHHTVRLQAAWLITLSLLGFSACQRPPRPGFSFVPLENPEAGDTIYFTNESRRADNYDWDFGDGEGSRQEEPQHIFESAGVYDVTLTAFNEGNEASLTQKVSIHEPTLLGLIVSDSAGFTLQVATIRIYDDPVAWENEDEPLATAFTDQQGKVEFSNVEPVIYYALVSKKVPNGTWYYRGYTPELEQNEPNWFSVPCRWIPDEPHR